MRCVACNAFLTANSKNGMHCINSNCQHAYLHIDVLPKQYRNPTFALILERMLKLHESKSHDYAQDENVYSNFENCARAAGITVDQVFRVFKEVKQSRSAELLDKGKMAKNESIEDTLLDDCVYSVLRLAYWMDHKDKVNESK